MIDKILIKAGESFNRIKKGDLSLETIVIFILSIIVLAVVAYYFITKYHAGSHNILKPGENIVSGNFSTNFTN